MQKQLNCQDYLTGEELDPEQEEEDLGAQPLEVPEAEEAPSAAVMQGYVRRIAEAQLQRAQLPSGAVPRVPPVMPNRTQCGGASVAACSAGVNDTCRVDSFAEAGGITASSSWPRRNQTCSGDSSGVIPRTLHCCDRARSRRRCTATVGTSVTGIEASGDPLQKMLALQLQQNAMLMQKLLPRTQDPVLGALAGSDSGTRSGGGNIKGSLEKYSNGRYKTFLQSAGWPAKQRSGNWVMRQNEKMLP